MAVRPELLVQAFAAFVTGWVYAHVGRLIAGRRLSADARTANQLFAAWWLGLGLVELLSGGLDLAAAFDAADLAVVVTFANLVFLILCAALWGVTYYLTYLYTGSRATLWPLGAFYASLALAFLYLVAWMQPVGIDDTTLSVQLVYARQPSPTLMAAMSAALAVPVAAAAFAYGTLFFKVRDRTSRFRIAAVAGSFFLWFGWSAVSSLVQLRRIFPDSVALLVLDSTITLAVPILVAVAYRPPLWVRARFGLGVPTL